MKLAILGMAIWPPMAAQASTLTYAGLGAHSVVTVQAALGSTSIAGTFYGGELTWNWLGPAPIGFEQTVYTYCVDLFNEVAQQQAIADPSETTSSLGTGVSDAGGKVAWLLNAFFAPIHDAADGIGAAALQVAIWEALYDPTPDLTSGHFDS